MRPSAGERLEERADPEDAFGIKTVDRFVEHEHGRVAEQRRRDPEALGHAEREATDSLAGDASKPDLVEHVVDTGAADAVAEREPQKVVVRAATAVGCARVEQRPDLQERTAVLAVVPPVHRHRSRRRRIETDDHPHRRGLSGAVRPEEPGHLPWRHGERQVVDRDGGAVALGETGRFDHLFAHTGLQSHRHGAARDGCFDRALLGTSGNQDP